MTIHHAIRYFLLLIKSLLLPPDRLLSSKFNHITAHVPLMLSPLLVHLHIPLWKSTATLSAIPHIVSGMNFLENFANLFMMSPYHCHLVFLSPVHHHHYHHHHFHYASLYFSSPLQTLPQILPTIVSLTFLDGSHGFLWPFPDLIAHRFLFFFSLFCLICVTN